MHKYGKGNYVTKGGREMRIKKWEKFIVTVTGATKIKITESAADK